MDSDTKLVVLVTPPEGKKPMVLADVCCHAAQTMGITSLNLVEHTMTPKLED